MAKDTKDSTGRQSQDSRQSGEQGREKPATGKPAAGEKSRPGIGSSQGQDRASPEREPRPSGGTPDIERGGGGGDVERGTSSRDSRDSLVQDPTGAFKERP